MTSSLPDFQKGLEYWEGVDASVDGVLGGFGEGPLPRVEQLGSRLFLLSLLPQLQSFPSPLSSYPRPSTPSSSLSNNQLSLPPNYRITALDVGAGVGRVTAETLLPLCDDVVTIEPVRHFIEAGVKEASSGGWRFLDPERNPRCRKGRVGRSDTEDEGEGGEGSGSGGGLGNIPGPRVWFIRAPLNHLDPAYPLAAQPPVMHRPISTSTSTVVASSSTSTSPNAGAQTVLPTPTITSNPQTQKESKSGSDLKPEPPTIQNLGVYGGTGGDGTFGERRKGEMMYDVIWCQWCLGHLDDPSLIEFLKRAKSALRHPVPSPSSTTTTSSLDIDMDAPNNSLTTKGSAEEASEDRTIHERYPSVIVVKENMCEDGPVGSEARAELDEEDSSLTRSNAAWLHIFQQAGLTLVKEQVQEGLPKGLFAVKMFALR